MAVRNVCMVGGPPWGLRFAPTQDGRIRITQVLPNGRADREKVRIGDIVESVNGQLCTSYRMLHAKVRSARGVLRLRLTRVSAPVDGRQPNNKQLPPLPAKSTTVQGSAAEFIKSDDSKSSHDTQLASELATIVERSETVMPMDHPLNINIYNDNTALASPKFYRNHAPSGIFPPQSLDFADVTGYNGDMRGSAHEKRRFFEMLANKKMFRVPTHMDQLLHRKIEFGSPSVQSSDQGTVVSGYDSVGGDFAGFAQSTATDTGRQSPSSSDFAEEDCSLEKQAAAPPALATTAAVVPASSRPAYPSTSSVYSPFPDPEFERDPIFSLGPLPKYSDNGPFSSVLAYDRSTTLRVSNGQSKEPQTAAAAVPNEEPAQLLDGHEIESLVSKIQTLQSNFIEPSECANSKSEVMETVLPPPPPPPLQATTLKSGSSSGEMKWKMRTEVRNGTAGTAGNSMMQKAQGSIEIPERQTVASLREQIANKLEVKMPSSNSADAATATTATDNDTFAARLLPKAQPFLDKQQYSCVPPYDSTYQAAPNASTSVVTSAQQPYQKAVSEQQQSVVHEPVQRHLSCITPVPFSRTAVLTSSATFPPTSPRTYPSNASPSPAAFYHSATFSPAAAPHENNGYDGSSPTDTTRTTQLNDYPKLEPVDRYTADGHQRQLPSLSPAMRIPATATGTSYYREQATIVPSASSQPAQMISGHNKGGDESWKGSGNQEKLAPTKDENSAVNDRTDVPHNDRYDANGQFGATSSSVVTTPAPATAMPPFSKPVQPRSGAVHLVTGPFHQSFESQQPRTTTVNNGDASSVPEWEPRNNTSAATAPRYEAQTENSKWYRNMFKKMHVIDQPDHSVLRYQHPEFISPVSTVKRTARAWTPNPRRDNEPGSLRNYELESRRSKSVGRCVEINNGMEQHSNSWREGELGWRSELGRPDDQQTGDVAELKRLAKEEVLTRQKVEKLSEELQQQRSRRHGYVPSASPALQKNFDRFNGLLSEFGGAERSVTPRALSPGTVATCTALYSFRALNPKELSFNRGDVIRVHRIIDVNWMQGERSGQTGIFPSSYVQIDSNKVSEQIKLIALYPFFARNKNELSLKKGETLRYLRTIDANWVEGINTHGKAGIFPKSYVREAATDEADLHEGAEKATIPDRPKTPRISSTSLREESPVVSAKTNHGSEVEGWQRRHSQEGLTGLAHIVPKNAETYRAVYAYKPKNADELELQENDIIFVVEKCDDGWFIGTLLRTGQFGTFPGNYVERH